MAATPYIDKDYWAKRKNYANWNAYEAANPNAPTEFEIEESIDEATGIINEKIGSWNVSIEASSEHYDRVQKLCYRMVNRIRQIDLGQGLPGKIPLFSPNDFLIDRERRYLMSDVGVSAGYRVLGGVSTRG
jgi:hypothetical protein